MIKALKEYSKEWKKAIEFCQNDIRVASPFNADTSRAKFTIEDIKRVEYKIINPYWNDADYLLVGQLKDQRWFSLSLKLVNNNWDETDDGTIYVGNSLSEISTLGLNANDKDLISEFYCKEFTEMRDFGYELLNARELLHYMEGHYNNDELESYPNFPSHKEDERFNSIEAVKIYINHKISQIINVTVNTMDAKLQTELNNIINNVNVAYNNMKFKKKQEDQYTINSKSAGSTQFYPVGTHGLKIEFKDNSSNSDKPKQLVYETKNTVDCCFKHMLGERCKNIATYIISYTDENYIYACQDHLTSLVIPGQLPNITTIKYI